MFYKQFEILCNKNGTTPTRFTKDVLGLSSSKITAWKNGSIPKIETLQSIAEYFNVSVGYLFDGTEKSSPSELSENELIMLDVFAKLTPEQQNRLIGRAEAWAEQNEADAKKKDRVS